MKTKAEAILATAASGASWLANVNEVVQLAIGVLTLVWWIRLIVSKKKDPKP